MKCIRMLDWWWLKIYTADNNSDFYSDATSLRIKRRHSGAKSLYTSGCATKMKERFRKNRSRRKNNCFTALLRKTSYSSSFKQSQIIGRSHPWRKMKLAVFCLRREIFLFTFINATRRVFVHLHYSNTFIGLRVRCQSRSCPSLNLFESILW